MKKTKSVLKSFEKELKAQDCEHQHLRFDVFGHAMTCIDCPQKWRPVDKSGNPDFLLGNVKNAMMTRHGAFEAPRFTKIR